MRRRKPSTQGTGAGGRHTGARRKSPTGHAAKVQIAFRFRNLSLGPRDIFEKEGTMTLKRLMTAFVIAASVGGSAGIVASPAHAQNAVEAEIIGFHQLCDKGDRKACVRFGILIGQNQQRHADWRRAHADWFWWER